MIDPHYAAKAIIGASVAKDAFEYSISYKQTLNNKKIPEDKRKLVASLDLATGLLSCVSQLIIGFAIANEKLQDKISKYLFKDLIEYKKIKAFEKCKAGLVIISSLLISTIITKRILVPLLATPIASLMNRKNSNKINENTNKNIFAGKFIPQKYSFNEDPYEKKYRYHCTQGLYD